MRLPKVALEALDKYSRAYQDEEKPEDGWSASSIGTIGDADT